MRLKFAVAMLLSAIVVFASPAEANRTDSGYSPSDAPPMLFQGGAGGVYWLGTALCTDSAPGCSGGFGPDLFVEITPNNLSLPLDVTLDLTSSFDANGSSTPDPPVGQIDCLDSTLGFLGGGTGRFLGPCTFSNTNGAAPAGCTLPNPTPPSMPGTPITIVIPSSCLQAGEVFYFDLADTNNIFITPGSATVPEPSSLALLGAALIPVAFVIRRRQEA